MIISRILKALHERWIKRSSESYINYLRRQGVQIGKNTIIQSPKTSEIDITRPSLVTIGENCFFNNYFELLTHDWVSQVFIHSGRNVVNSSERVIIGNNVSCGRHVLILKGVTIGDNVFIGANSIVTKSIPSNTIAIGIPARVIMTLDEYYNKCQKESEQRAFDYARSIKERFNRVPEPKDFRDEFPLFVSGQDMDNFPEIPCEEQLGPMADYYRLNHVSKYSTFEDFLKAAGL